MNDQFLFYSVYQPGYVKKEIDISIFSPNMLEKCAIELKYPRNGQYPEQMFKSCQDIRFLEQLRQNGFIKCCFMSLADDPLFYSGGEKTGIYIFFRAGVLIHGNIHKPTGLKDASVDISGNYLINWNRINRNIQYAVIEI